MGDPFSSQLGRAAQGRQWRAQILDPKTPGGRKKQLVTALARDFGVDGWRLQTGQTTPEKLGLVMNPPKTSTAQPSTPE